MRGNQMDFQRDYRKRGLFDRFVRWLDRVIKWMLKP